MTVNPSIRATRATQAGRGGTPVILLAHGSRRAGADQQIEQIAAALEAELASPANSDATWHAELASPAPVRAAFLDFSPATLYSVAEELVADGHRHAIVVPLLFTNAFHLNHDVPREIAYVERTIGLNLAQTAPVGLGEDVAELLVHHWRATANAGATPGAIGDAVVYSVGSSTPGANEAVADLADHVGVLLGVPARAIFATGGGPTIAAHRAGLSQRGVVTGQFGADATQHRAGHNQAPTAVLPLFFAPGLLLDKAHSIAADHPGEFIFSEPLGVALVGVLKNRVSTTATPETLQVIA